MHQHHPTTASRQHLDDAALEYLLGYPSCNDSPNRAYGREVNVFMLCCVPVVLFDTTETLLATVAVLQVCRHKTQASYDTTKAGVIIN